MKVTVGQLVSLLAKCASDSDELLMGRPIFDIGVKDDGIFLIFDDENMDDYHIKLDGTKEY